MVQGQVFQISGLFFRSLENDFLRTAVREVDAETVSEKRVCIKSVRHCKMISRNLQRYNPVHTIHPHAIPFDAIRGYVPSACAFLDCVRPQGVGRDVFTGVFPVADPDFQIVGHGFHDRSKIFVPGRNFFQRYPAGKAFLPERKQVVDSECVYQPGCCGIGIFYVFAVTDKITAGPAVAFDFYSENLSYCISVMVERTSRVC